MSITEIIKKFSKDSKKIVHLHTIASPIGKIIAAADEDFVYMISFEDSKNLEKKVQAVSENVSCRFVQGTTEVLQNLEDELTAYFSGKLTKFTVPIKTFGSSFQKQVWEKLQELPYGTHQTYGDLAKSLGRSASHSRAVGAACGANTHFLVVPCHRLISSSSIGGFNSGVDRKEWLLAHEKNISTKK